MAAAILNTPLAVEVSVYVVRAFVRLCEMLVSNAELARKLERLEHKLAVHDGKLTTHDETIAAVLSVIRELNESAGAAEEAQDRIYSGWGVSNPGRWRFVLNLGYASYWCSSFSYPL